MSINWQLLAEAREGLIVKLEKRLSDAALVEAELREEVATIRAALAEAIEEADACHDDEHGTPSPNLDAARAVLAKLKQKNGGDFAIDTELKRLGYPL